MRAPDLSLGHQTTTIETQTMGKTLAVIAAIAMSFVGEVIIRMILANDLHETMGTMPSELTLPCLVVAGLMVGLDLPILMTITITITTLVSLAVGS
jgi:hypothetical protein